MVIGMLQVLCFIVIVVGLIMCWVILYDTHHFIEVHKEVVSDKLKQKQRFVMLSDLHGNQYGRDNALLIEAIEKSNPDGILIAGDMITAVKKAKFTSTVTLLETLKEKYPIYYANGNHEQKLRLYKDRFGDLADELSAEWERIGIKPLVNEQTTLSQSGITIYGAEIGREYYKRFKTNPMEESYLTDLLGKPKEENYTILLAHNPEYFPQYAKWGADLVLSGHVHGGIMKLPFLGGVISPSVKLFPKYDGGEFKEQNSILILGRGLGTHSPNIRVFNPGELIIIDLLPDMDKL